MLEPVEAVTAPVADGDHHLCHISRHVAEVVAAVRRAKGDSFRTLRQSSSVSSEGAIRFMIVLLHMEWLVRIDTRG